MLGADCGGSVRFLGGFGVILLIVCFGVVVPWVVFWVVPIRRPYSSSLFVVGAEMGWKIVGVGIMWGLDGV